MTTLPVSPARAVRPARCRYSLGPLGGSTWSTRPTSSTWMPRAATSVATRTGSVPSLKTARMRVRAPWASPPCRAPASHPGCAQLLGHPVRPALGTDEDQRPARSGGDLRGHPGLVLAARCSPRGGPWWSRWPGRSRPGGSPDRSGSCWTSRSMALSKVAENSSRCPPAGTASRIWVTAGRKPRSAMWSASSSTAISIRLRSTAPCSIRSISRPGVATTMSTPRWKARSCGV